MVSLEGLTGIPDPKSGQSSRIRNSRQKPEENGVTRGKSADGVTISNEAKAAADVVRIVQLTRNQDEIRMDKVESARQNIANGNYKDPEVVAKVAEKIMKMLS